MFRTKFFSFISVANLKARRSANCSSFLSTSSFHSDRNLMPCFRYRRLRDGKCRLTFNTFRPRSTVILFTCLIIRQKSHTQCGRKMERIHNHNCCCCPRFTFSHVDDDDGKGKFLLLSCGHFSSICNNGIQSINNLYALCVWHSLSFSKIQQ